MGWNSGRKGVADLRKRGQGTLEDYKDVMRLCSEKIRKAETHLELELATALKGKSFYSFVNVFTSMLETKQGPRIIPSCIGRGQGPGGGTLPQRMRKRLRYLMPSLLQSLIARPDTLRVISPLNRKTGTRSRMKSP